MQVEFSQTRDVAFGRLHWAASEPTGGALEGEAHDTGTVGVDVVPAVKPDVVVEIFAVVG